MLFLVNLVMIRWQNVTQSGDLLTVPLSLFLVMYLSINPTIKSTSCENSSGGSKTALVQISAMKPSDM